MYRFGIVGADKRMKCLQNELIKDGYPAVMLGSQSDFGGCDVIVLPPACDFKSIAEKCRGKIVIAPEGGGEIIGYGELESFKKANAVASAEGAVFFAMQKTDRVICDMDIAVVGYGCIGKELLRILSGLGARVSVFARGQKPGCRDITELYGLKTDLLINTVPAKVITKDLLHSFPVKPIIIDLASKPGGVDFESAEIAGIPCFHELGIPGRYAPETAGKVLKETVISILEKVQNDR